ncbi:GNAT superfamily N-acetyltransferase [Paraburkholderia sp. GAS33]|uniref:GNAT family N-acetyltransferase n=1 Tax=Paraburkholderia sp. GAS33 TaxID=3035130 RepID=UPI003D1C3A69
MWNPTQQGVKETALFELRLATEDDVEFAFEVKRAPLGPHITVRWGWDDELQRRVHEQRWRERTWFIITVDGCRAGTVAIDEASTHIQFGEFYLLPCYQRKGIGTVVLRSVLRRADYQAKSVKLEYLKWNPVASLYLRHGFKVDTDNDTHFFLVRGPLHMNGRNT